MAPPSKEKPESPTHPPPPYENWEAEVDRVDINSLDPAQRALLSVHAADLVRMRDNRGTLFARAGIEIARGSNLYAFFRSVFLTAGQIIFALVANPSAPITDPLGFAYSVVSYSLIFIALIIAQFLLFVLKITRADLLIRRWSDSTGGGYSVVNWSSPEMFEASDVFEKAKSVLSTGPPDHCRLGVPVHTNEFTEEEIAHRLGGIKTQFFDLDVARALLLMSAIMYERDDRWVHQASEDRTRSERLLIRSELAIYKKAKQWDVRYTTISDFVTVSGCYVGAFYSAKGADGDPWIVVVFKGTSPATFSEWLTDVTFTHEAAGDFLWGNAHQGFYTTIFPAVGADVPSLPYRRIADAMGSIGRQLSQETGGKKVNLWISGHSLGAALASLFYASLLQSPPPKNDNLVLRDGYCFGTPAVGDGLFVSGFEKLMHAQENREKNFWRIANARDIVANVPPGLAGPRPNRISLNPRSLLNYGPIGVEIHLTPHARTPFYHIDSATVQAGTEISIVESDPSRKPNYAQLFRRAWNDPIVLLTRLADVFFPFLGDHAPPSYWNSLLKISGATRPSPDDPTYLHDPNQTEDWAGRATKGLGGVLGKMQGKRKEG